MMKAGKYYVGDLCYVFNREDWDEVCNLTINGNACLEGEFNLPDGRRFAMFGTAWGDGEYEDQNGHKYSVDSGTIGCTLVENISAEKYSNLEELGRIVVFDKDFKVSEDHGTINIGNLNIETNPDYQDNDEEECEEEY